MGKGRLLAFGDSFTIGDGSKKALIADLNSSLSSNSSSGERKSIINAVRTIKHQHSWVAVLAEKLQLDPINKGETGNSNFKIFNSVFRYFANNEVTQDDLVCIMWSSSLRDYLPFMPGILTSSSPIGLGWSLKEVFDNENPTFKAKEDFFTYYDGFVKNKTDSEIQYLKEDLAPFFKDFAEDYLLNLYDEDYYRIVNQNYILILQHYLKSKGINFLMVDAFESMTNFGFSDKLIERVDRERYYGFNETTVWDYLDSFNDESLFEDKTLAYNPKGNKLHPSEFGYVKIAEELYSFIVGK